MAAGTSVAESLLVGFIASHPGAEHIVLGNSFGTTVASASSPALAPAPDSLGGLFAATFGVTAETADKLSSPAKTRSVVAYFSDYVLLQFSSFPLVLAVRATPLADMDRILQVEQGESASDCRQAFYFPSLQDASELLVALEPLRAAAEQIM